MSFLVFFAALWMFALAVHAEYSYPDVIEMKDVHVLEKLDHDSFRMDVANVHGIRSAFTAHFCPYSDITQEIQRGMILDVWYMEDRVHDCWDVSPGHDRGYNLKRSEYDHKTPVIFDAAETEARRR